MVLVIAAEDNLECWQLDYNTAFLNADVMEEVCVKMAPGYEEFDDKTFPMVMSLLKGLYGFRQSPINWWGTIHDSLGRGDRLQKPQVGPLRLHLLGGRDHRHFDPVCRRHPAARKIRRDAQVDQT